MKQRNEHPGRPWDADVTVGASPSVEDVENLARAGFRAILDLDEEVEPGEVLSPNVEATWAHTFEMEHERLDVPLQHLHSELVDAFVAKLKRTPRPVYVHSMQAQRAAAFVSIADALERGRDGADALAELETRGFALEEPVLRGYVVEEVDRRRAVRRE